MKYILLVLLLCLASPCHAGFATLMGGSNSTAAPPAGPSVTMYYNCESVTNGASLQKGTGTISIVDNALALVTGSVGSYAVSISGTWRAMAIPNASNLSATVGTIGFYFNRLTNTGNDQNFWTATDYAAGGIKFAAYGTDMYYQYKSGEQAIANALAEVRFIELSWDGTANKMSYRIGGGSWTETTGLTGTTPTAATNMTFGYDQGYDTSATFDQIIVSDTYQADLYSVRNSTSF